MKNLINDLKKEHEELANTLDSVRELGIASEKGKTLLFNAKNTLLRHLAKEDENLYPKLNSEAIKDENLKKTLDIFSEGLTEVSNEVNKFFIKYDTDADINEISKDFGKLLCLLKTRIRKEENILYKEYEKRFN